MGGKKTVEKSREWEKERRDKLNTGFNDLCKLLPDHDPSISLSKMDILRRAAEYIRSLQDQNEEIIKSGDNTVLRNEAERLKKRVAYLLLKTKELVTALKAAGVPIPNNNKKKKKSKAQKVVNGKDQNRIPNPPGESNVGQVPCVVVGNAKPVVSIALSCPAPGKKVKCGCDKAAKKNPLSEVNCTSTATTSGHPIPCHVTVVPSVAQPGPTILGAPVQANIQTLAPTLGPGTLIFRDGRVVTLPPAPVIPQILVKPQPTLIVMQRAPAAPQKRDKVPLIAPKRREITQTTYANKAPIPAIKTFRLESYPRPYKPKGKKKKEDTPSTKTSATSTNNKTTDSPSELQTKPPVSSNLKRRGEPVIRKSKIAKPISQPMKPADSSIAPKDPNPSKTHQSGEVETPEKIAEANQSVEGENIPRTSLSSNLDNANGSSPTPGAGSISSTGSKLMQSAQQPIQDCASNDRSHIADRSKSDGASVELRESANIESAINDNHEKTNVAVSSSISSQGSLNSSAEVVVCSHSSELHLVQTDNATGAARPSAHCSIADSSKESFAGKTAEAADNENVIDGEIVCGNVAETEKSSVHEKPCVSDSNRVNDAKNDSRFPEVSERKNFVVDVDQFQNHNQPCYTLASTGNMSAPKTSDAVTVSSMPANAGKSLGVSSSASSCGYVPSTVAPVSADVEIPCSFPSSSSFPKPSGTSSSLPSKLPPSTYLPCQSSLPVTSLFSSTTTCLQGYSMAQTTPTCSFSTSMELAPGSASHVITTASHSYPSTSLPLHITPSHSSIADPHATNFVDNTDKQKTSKPDIDSSTLSRDSNQTLPSRQSQKGSELDRDLCTVVNSLENAKHESYQNKPQGVQNSSKQMEDSQCTKRSNLQSDTVIETPQKRSYSEHLDRTNTHAPQIAKSIHSSISSGNFTSMNTSLTSNNQVYSFGLPVVATEPSRPESFFNYDNPIATIPSDPFFSNFKPPEMPVSCAANSGFGYSTFTTQAPPVRSVARQLFPADPLCSISNSYNLDANLPPLSSTTAGQMFQFSSYSNTNSFRDPLLFTNDFLSTPTKNTAIESVAPDKEPSLNNTHSFHDLIHPNTSVSFSNISCSFSVGQMPPSSATYVTSDFNRINSDQTNRKQYQPTAGQPMFRNKQTPKSGGDGNFSMNVITSTSDLKDHRNSDYAKPADTQNFNFPYLNAPQSLAPQMNLDSFNFNVRDPVQHSQNVPSHTLVSHNLMNASNAGKNLPKTTNHSVPPKSTLSKEFPTNTSSSSTRGQCDAPPNVFQNDNNTYPNSAKSTQGTNNFRICGNNSQSSNQGVQTHQSYLYNPNQPNLNKPQVPSSGSQIFSCSSQANQIHSAQYNKKYIKTVQDTPYAGNHMKITGGQPEAGDCSLIVHSHKNYQPVTSLVHTPNTSSVNFSASSMFPQNPNCSVQGPLLGSYSSVPPASQSVYSNPTTATSNEYSQDVSRNNHNRNNLFRIGHVSTNTARSNQTQPNLCSSSSQIFSTVESLAQQNLQTSQNHKNQNGNQMESHTQLDQSHTFTGMGGNHPNPKNPQTDMMSSFSMSNITGYSQNALPESHSIAKSQSHTYPQLANTKQANSTKPPQYPPSSSHNPTAKQCEYPLSSILTGLNDPVLNSSLVSNETPQGKATANASTQKTCNDKIIDKQYSTNTEGNSFKTTESTTCNGDYLQSKEADRSFIPIIEDVRLNSEFSNDLFSSLQVPTGGAHADSTSPTAAFLLAFPLVSTSKNADNPHESDPQDNNTSTPTTILQIGNIEPSNSEMFHPLEFGKDMEPSDYLVQDKCKRKDIAKQKKPNMYNSYSYPSMSGDYNVHYDQTWSDQSKKAGDVRKRNEKQNKFCGSANEACKDKKKKSKITVNWMAAPDVENYQKEQEASSFQASLSFPMDIDALPDLCANKKTNTYSWSPSKSLLPLDPGLVIPSTLPTLVGDLALGTPTPSDQYKRCDNKKQDKSPEKQNQKSQSNFLSVSQLVDPKSKKKLPEKCKKAEKKKSGSFPKRKEPGAANEPCMYPDNFLPPLGWDKYRYRNNYSAEALISSQDVNETVNFTYQQNPNYFVGPELNPEHHQSQQYQNFNFSQNQFPPPFIAEEYQNTSFSLNNAQSSATKRGGPVDKRDVRCREEASRFSGPAPTAYHGHPPYTTPAPPSSVPSSHSSNFTSTTTSVTNFNLSTIFPEINERTGSQGPSGPSQQHPRQQQQHQHGQSHPHNVNTFQTPNQTSNYRAHNL